MQRLVSAISSIKAAGGKKDDDRIDRLSNKYTVGILIAFTVAVSSFLAFSKAIICWTDKHFTGAWVRYTNSYCWVKNTYYLPLDEHIPKEGEPRDYIPYYQWIPFILLAQAVGFYMPSVVWHAFNQQGGVDADTILVAAQSMAQVQDISKRDTTLKCIWMQMDRFLFRRQEHPTDKDTKTLTPRETVRLQIYGQSDRLVIIIY